MVMYKAVTEDTVVPLLALSKTTAEGYERTVLPCIRASLADPVAHTT
jgi:hypothetical protein